MTEALGKRGVPEPRRLAAAQKDMLIQDILSEPSGSDTHGAEGADSQDTDAGGDGERIVLFSGLSTGSIGVLMREIRALQVPGLIFAMVTEQSRRWALGELVRHLRAEDQAAHRRGG